MPEPPDRLSLAPPVPAESRAVRLALLGAAGVLTFLALRLIDLQVLCRGRLAARAGLQHERVAAIPPRRGEIRDRQGRAMAMTLMVPSVFAEPRRLRKEPPARREAVARALASALGVDPGAVRAELAKDRAFVWVKRQALDAQWKRLEAMKLPGIGMRSEPRRFYPHGTVAGPLLGGTGVDGQPLAALELEYQTWLAGQEGRLRVLRDARGRTLLEDADDVRDPADGAHVVTTVDLGVQEAAERALDRLLEHCPCKSAVALVMDPSTGEILAMASRPGYDPNRPREVPRERFQNPAVLLCFEPGSTFKPFVIGPALAEGVVRPDERLFCHNGTWHVRGRKPLHDYHPHGWLTVTEVVAQSSNIGAAQVGIRMGMPRIHAHLRCFGFGARTGIDLPGEQAGILNPARKWTGATVYSVPMGHEIAVTPIQLLAAFNVFANGGRWVRPHLLREVRSPQGECLKAWAPPPARQVLPEASVRGPILEALKAVVDHGTAKGSKPRGVLAAGKTGTAQKIGPDGQYLHDAWVSSYVCFAPAERPRYTVLVVVDEPRNRKGGYTGGAVAAPVAKDILETVLAPRAAALAQAR